ncbi:hypothetical protein J4466_00635 [Candidatus Pacearchaeota archaeon]|nr:hypothetical protein [Candidatus Pacearchaeota archaeon]
MKQFRVLDQEGNPVEMTEYQKSMADYNRLIVEVMEVRDTDDSFIFPYEGTIKVRKSDRDTIVILKPEEDENEVEEIDYLKKDATINDKYKLIPI